MKIAATMIAMEHILGFNVLAAGVETTAKLEFLRKKTAIGIKVISKARPCRRKRLLSCYEIKSLS